MPENDKVEILPDEQPTADKTSTSNSEPSLAAKDAPTGSKLSGKSLKEISVDDLLNDELWNDSEPASTGGDNSQEAASEEGEDSTHSVSESEEAESDKADGDDTIPEEFDPDVVNTLIRQNQELLSLKGKQGQKIHERDTEITRLTNEIAELRSLVKSGKTEEAAQATDDEDLAAKLLSNPKQVLRELVEEVEAEKQAKARETYDSQLKQVAPVVGAQLFAMSASIENFDEWTKSQEGEDVKKLLAEDPARRKQLAAASHLGDVEWIAQTMVRALKDVRMVRDYEKGKEIVNTTKAKVEANKTTIPSKPVAPRAPAIKSQNIYDLKVEDILNIPDSEFGRLTASRKRPIL